MFRSQLGVHTFIRLTETNCFETTIIRRKFLFDNICLDRNSETVGLSGQVGSSMIIHTIFLKITITQITPQDSGHPQFVSILESLSDFHQLATTLFRTEIDSSANSRSSHIPCFFHCAEHHLIIRIRIGQQFIMIQFNHKRNFMGIFACHRSQNAECRSDRITTAFNSQFHNILRIEVDRIRSKRRSGSMFNILIDRKNGYITGISQTSMSENSLQAVQHFYITVGINPYFIYRIGRRHINQRLINSLTSVIQIISGFISQQINYFTHNFTFLNIQHFIFSFPDWLPLPSFS